MIAIPWVPGNKETSKEIRNRKICTGEGHGSRGQRWQGLNTKASSLPPLPPAHETNPVRKKEPCARGRKSKESGTIPNSLPNLRQLIFCRLLTMRPPAIRRWTS